MPAKRLVAVHLLNDYSGSPLVLRQAVETLKLSHNVVLYTATPGAGGFLSGMDGIELRPLFYKWHKVKVVTLFYFLLSQCLLFIKLFKALKKSDAVYINTLLPFGAALAAKLKGCTITYHVHEVSIKPRLLKNFLVQVANRTASEALFVSRYVANQSAITKPATRVVYNSLSATFANNAYGLPSPNICAPFTVLMLCSLKSYKGIYEFVAIAKKLPRLKFLLVLNATAAEVERFKTEVLPSDNCVLYAAQKETLLLYRKAHLVVNLSKPDGWVETFGMTVLEAMQAGRPVIVPPLGGVCEVVDHGVQGYHIHSGDEEALMAAMNGLSSNFRLYRQMARAARQKASGFSTNRFATELSKSFSSSTLIQNNTPSQAPVMTPVYGHKN